MRVAILLASLTLASCASEKLALAPPAGVDFSGHWKLNEADSDDPQRLMLAAVNPSASAPAGDTGGSGSPGGSGGRGGGRQGGRSGGGGMPMGAAGPSGPATPPLNAIGEGLHWPGKDLEIKQVAGVVAFTSGGVNRLCQPSEKLASRRHHSDRDDRDDRDARDDVHDRSRPREDPPVHCGWAEKTLIVQGGDPDEDRPPFEERYSVSEDGQRLVEVVGFKGGRSNGFTMSRVWDKLQQ